jgi:rsbT co-antagonist protein RsbR
MRLNLHDVGAQELMAMYCISEEDLERVRRFGEQAIVQMATILDEFYAWLGELPDFEEFFSDQESLDRVRKLQHQYWVDFMEGKVDDAYVQKRQMLGEVHARIGLPLNTYLAGMSVFQDVFTRVVMEGDFKAEEKIPMVMSVAKLLNLDTAIVVDTINRLVEETITAQSRSLMEMSTPVTEIWSKLLFLPIVGIIDTRRSRDIMNATLAKIAETQAKIAILDISGVGVVDTAVANHLIKITRATRLMGCETTISGVSPAIATTIVELGIDVGEVQTTATMRDALADAVHLLEQRATRSR